MFNWLKKVLHVEQTSKHEKLISALVFFVFIFAMGYLGNDFSQEFYDELVKPSVTPPQWVFPLVWAALFILIGMSGYWVWNFYKNEKFRKIFTLLYVINGILVYMWSDTFFGQQQITNALYIVVGMIIVAELMILAALRTNKKAAYALIPYLLWLLFATYLNTTIIVLNV